MATDRVAVVVRVGVGGRRGKREIRQMSRGRKERPIIDGFLLPPSLPPSLRDSFSPFRRGDATHAHAQAGQPTPLSCMLPAR